MTEDKYAIIGLTLDFYREAKIKVHIKLVAGRDAGCFRNGYILSVDSDKREFLIVDDVLGNKSYTFYEINEQIVPYLAKGGE